MATTTLKQKLVCPYCNEKQSYRAKDGFAPYTTVSHDIQCEGCDWLFNAQITGENEVKTFTNLLETVCQ
jgi:rubredoxin